jgi:hypothetical protein
MTKGSPKNAGEKTSRPPKLGGQRDRDEVEIARAEVPKLHLSSIGLGNLPSRGSLRARAALLTQEGKSHNTEYGLA